jgi:hypothetical protein
MPAGRKFGGRKKGTPNKITVSVKTVLEQAFQEIGGLPSLVKWGKKNPDEFYRLWAKLLPKEISMSLDLDDKLSRQVREKLDEVDGLNGGQPGEAGGTDAPLVGDAAAPSPGPPGAGGIGAREGGSMLGNILRGFLGPSSRI